jgi:hypothetical protein
VSRHVGRLLTVAALVVGLGIHIGLGYRFGLLIAGVGLVGHVLLGVAARKLRRRTVEAGRRPSSG